MIKFKEYKPNYEFTFGKYKGKTFEYVLENDASYILWCDENIKWFTIENKELKEHIEKFSERQSRRSSYSTGFGYAPTASEQGHLDCFGHSGPNGGWGNIF